MNWKKQTQAEVLRGIQKTSAHDRQIYTLSREGRMARNYLSENAHKIEAHFHYNGSRPIDFGGAKQWPVISVEISFQEGQTVARDAFVEKLRTWLDENLP